MQKIAVKLMQKVIRDLPENLFAYELLRYVQHGNRLEHEQFFSEIFSTDIYENHEYQLKSEYDEVTLNKDYRFKRLYLKNFRKFPAVSETSFYGLSFINSRLKTPESFFYIGSNGTGKTSLFSAMEELCTGKISAAAFRYYSGEDKKKYMPYWGTSYNDVSICLDTVAGKYSYHEEEDRINFSDEEKDLFSAFFTSENDNQIVSKNKDDITGFVYEQIGFGYVYWLLIQLEREKEIIIDFKRKNEGKVLIDSNEEFAQNRDRVKVLTSLLPDIWKLGENKDVTGLLRTHDNLINISGVDSFLQDTFNPMDYKSFLKSLEEEKKGLVELYPEIEYISTFYSNQIAQIQNIIDSTYKKGLDDLRKNKLVSFLRERKLPQSVVNLDSFKTGRYTLLSTLRNALLFLTENSSLGFFLHGISQKIFELTERNKKLLHEKDLVLSDYEKNILYEKHYPFLTEVYECLKKHFVEEVSWAIDCLRKIVTPILDLFTTNDEEFKMFVDENQYTFEIRVSDKKQKGKWSYPRLYLNSFRYKLYCICLRISIAFCVKHYFRINFPLVLDDVFYSSDFSNREKVEDFMEKIITFHDELFRNEISPLQIIFFTHDTLILNAATSGANKTLFPFQHGRIFDHNEVVEETDVLDVDNIKIYQLADLYKY